jgi:hypothetical protein
MALAIVRQTDHFLATFSGTMGPEDLLECAVRTAELEEASPEPLDRIADLSPVETFNVNFLAVSDLAKKRRDKRYGRLIKSALVADRPVAVGFARMYQTILNNPDIDVRIFPSLAEARAWLADKNAAAEDPHSGRPASGA